MLRLVILIIFLCTSCAALASAEILMGVISGPLEFEDRTSSPKDELDSANFGLQVSVRASARFGKALVGAVAHQSWSDMSLNKNYSISSDNSFERTSYGAYLGLFITENFKANIEFYPSSNLNIVWAENKAGNYFVKNDKLKGRGAGFGLSYAQGGFFYELLYQYYRIDKVSLSGVNYVVNDNSLKFNDPNVQTVGLFLGFIF